MPPPPARDPLPAATADAGTADRTGGTIGETGESMNLTRYVEEGSATGRPSVPTREDAPARLSAGQPLRAKKRIGEFGSKPMRGYTGAPATVACRVARVRPVARAPSYSAFLVTASP